jgi:signal transduction histidine kinase
MNMLKPRVLLIVTMIAAAAASRLIPHPPNMTSIAAMALFGGATLTDKRLAFLVPLAALFASDVVLGFHNQMVAVYGSFALIVCFGLWLQQRKTALTIAGAAIASSLLFFIVVDFGIWLMGDMYPRTFAGLAACYTAALPFLRNQMVGDLLYTAVLFGGFALLERQFPVLRLQAPAPA